MNRGPQTLSSATKYLKGLDMPADKQEIIQTAHRNQAPQDVIDLLQKLPDRSFQQMDDIWREIGSKL